MLFKIIIKVAGMVEKIVRKLLIIIMVMIMGYILKDAQDNLHDGHQHYKDGPNFQKEISTTKNLCELCDNVQCTFVF